MWNLTFLLILLKQQFPFISKIEEITEEDFVLLYFICVPQGCDLLKGHV